MSEGRDEAVLDAIAAAFAPPRRRAATARPIPTTTAPSSSSRARPGSCTARSPPAPPRPPRGSTCARTTACIPRVGALDVAPVVFLDDEQRGAAIAEALLAADAIGARGIPVFLYGELARRADPRRAAQGRAGGPRRARHRRPTTARPQLHPTAGATLVAARPPLIAFNLELAPPATLEDARASRRR